MGDDRRRTLSNRIAARLVPHRFLAAQLRRPSGWFGRWVMTRGLNEGNADLIDATIDALAIGGDDVVLDVGFGGGRALRIAAERTRGALYGVDVAPDMVAQGQRTLAALVRSGRLSLLTADVTALPLRDGLVDAICTTNTIYFWEDLDAALAELARVLAPGGRVAFGYTGSDKMRRFDEITRHGFRTFTPDELAPALRAAGFDEIRSEALYGRVTEGDFVTLARTRLAE